MKIIAGKHRGRIIASPPGDKTRPTSSRTREAVFNLLLHHRAIREGNYPSLQDAAVADLCCGTGALGFEALSRGAASVTFVDISAPVLKAVGKTAEQWEELAQCRMIKASAPALPAAPHVHDIALLDPPYDAGLVEPTLDTLHAKGWLAGRALVVAETHANTTLTLPSAYTLLDERRYGAAMIRLLGYSNI